MEGKGDKTDTTQKNEKSDKEKEKEGPYDKILKFLESTKLELDNGIVTRKYKSIELSQQSDEVIFALAFEHYKEPEGGINAPGFDEHDDEDNDILSHLNFRKLQKIKQDFQKNNDQGLSLDQFIAVMLQHLPVSRDMVGLVKNLIELFRQIDVNDDKSLEWNEFTGHIIELGMVGKDRTLLDSIKNYHPSTTIFDNEKHDTMIEKMYFFDKLRHIIVLEQDQKRFKVYDSKKGKWLQNVPEKNEAQGAPVLAAEYIEFEKGQTKYVATSHANNHINLWDANNYVWRGKMPTRELQFCLRWDPNEKILYSGGINNTVTFYDINKMQIEGVSVTKAQQQEEALKEEQKKLQSQTKEEDKKSKTDEKKSKADDKKQKTSKSYGENPKKESGKNTKVSENKHNVLGNTMDDEDDDEDSDKEADAKRKEQRRDRGKEKKQMSFYKTTMDILIIPGRNLIASASLDSDIYLWTLEKREEKNGKDQQVFKRYLSEKNRLKDHPQEVHSLEWYPDGKLILSAGLDHEIYLWNPIVAEKIFVLSGHQRSIVAVKHLKYTKQVISADMSGIVRIWDMRDFSTVQQFTCSLTDINCFVVTSPPKRIVCGGKKLMFFDYNEPTNNHLADDQACIAILYNPIFYTFITAHPKCVKIWDATTGALKSVFRDLTSKEITTICMDSRQRKLFVGDSRGKTMCVNIKNGAIGKNFNKEKERDQSPKKKKDLDERIKELERQDKKKDKEEISSLCYWQGEAKLITASWDGLVRIFDDGEAAEEGQMRNIMDKHKGSVNYIDFRVEDQFYASCGDDGQCLITNCKSQRQECSLSFNKNEKGTPGKIYICKFLKGTDILVTTDEDGFLVFYCVVSGQHPLKNKILCYVRDNAPADVGDQTKLPYQPMRGLDYDYDTKTIYTGDEKGYMIKWDISKLVQKLKDLTSQDFDEIGEQGKIKLKNKAFMTSFKEAADLAMPQNTDVVNEYRWSAHTELINMVTYVKELEVIASCSFDCNVYMWNREGQKVGSLVLGTGLLLQQEQDENTKKKLAETWQIKVDKEQRFIAQRKEALHTLCLASRMSVETMFGDVIKKDKSSEGQLEKVKKESRNNQRKKNEEQLLHDRLELENDLKATERTDNAILDDIRK